LSECGELLPDGKAERAVKDSPAENRLYNPSGEGITTDAASQERIEHFGRADRGSIRTYDHYKEPENG
jgi:hypothetical protein